jgi:hypothetical protein
MTASINTQVIAALSAAHAYGKAIATLRTALKGQLSPEVRDTLLPYVAGYYKVALVAKTRGEGVTLDTEAKQYEAAKKALQRMTKDIVGGSVDRTVVEAPKLTREQLRLIRLCHEAGVTMKLFGQGVAQLK